MDNFNSKIEIYTITGVLLLYFSCSNGQMKMQLAYCMCVHMHAQTYIQSAVAK